MACWSRLLDDVIIGSNGFGAHIDDLKKVFDRLQQHHLAIKLSKCKFFRKKLIYLGHEISKDGVRPDPEKVTAIAQMKPPMNIHGLRRFLGLTSYYRRFIANYAQVAEPLTCLLRKNNLYKWNSNSQKAFEELKQHLVEVPILAYPDFKQPFQLYTDASTYGLGAILSQSKSQGDQVIAYASRTMNKAERNYSTTERECTGHPSITFNHTSSMGGGSPLSLTIVH